MGSSSYSLRPGETLEQFIVRDCPNTEFVMVERMGNYVFAAMKLPANQAPNFEPDAEGNVIIIGVAKFESGFVKYMEEDMGPFTYGARCSSQMLARASAIKPYAAGYAAKFRARMSEALA